MAPGKSPLVRALGYFDRKVAADLRVVVAKRRFERDPLGRALALFDELEMTRTTHRNGILIYFNTATRRFAIITDEGVHREMGQGFWDELAMNLREDLMSTYFENAVALNVYALAATLERKYPPDVL